MTEIRKAKHIRQKCFYKIFIKEETCKIAKLKQENLREQGGFRLKVKGDKVTIWSCFDIFEVTLP